MGHEISYCGRCANRIGGTDFEKGKAYRLSGQNVCATCLTPDERHTIATSSATREKSTTRIKLTKPGPGTSTKIPATRSEPAASASKTSLTIALAAGAIVLVGGGLLLMSGSKPPPPETVTRPPDGISKPAPKHIEPPREEKPEDPQVRDARLALETARAKAKAAPGDLEAQRIVWEEAARKAALTPFFREASTELQAVRDKLAALKPPDPAVPPEPVKPPAVPVTPPQPPEPVKPAPADPGVPLALWTAAMTKATAGDLDGAAADLRKDPAGHGDADLLTTAAIALRGSREELAALPAGHPISLLHRVGGIPQKVEGTIVKASASRLEIKQGAEIVPVEMSDITSGSIVALTRPSPQLHRRYAVLCILDGDREAAERLVGPNGFPARYWDYAKDAASKVSQGSPREQEARRLFSAAEREYAKVETIVDAIAKYKTLHEQYADTSVVKAAPVRVKVRAEGGKDYFLTAYQLKGSAGYSLAAYPRCEAAWTSKADVDGPQAVANYVAAEFAAVPGASYKAWALIGACCTDTFLFYLQATDGTDVDPRTRKKESIEPGAGMASVVKHTLKELARSHRSHVVKVPKSPLRWEWIPIPLPKYASPGLKKIHLISDQQGFSVGAVVVSSTRTAPPPDAELKEEAARAKAAVVEDGRSIENPGEKAWKPLFDGKTKDVLRNDGKGWKVEDGKLFRMMELNDAAQTREDFSDGEVRVRFEIKDGERVWFKLRQGAGGGYLVTLTDVLKTLDLTKPHDVVITAKGETVTATLDGKPVPVTSEGSSARGPLQFNGFGKSFAVLTLDFRP